MSGPGKLNLEEDLVPGTQVPIPWVPGQGPLLWASTCVIPVLAPAPAEHAGGTTSSGVHVQDWPGSGIGGPQMGRTGSGQLCHFSVSSGQ